MYLDHLKLIFFESWLKNLTDFSVQLGGVKKKEAKLIKFF